MRLETQIGGEDRTMVVNRQPMPMHNPCRANQKKSSHSVLLIVLTRLSRAGYDPRESSVEFFCRGLNEYFLRNGLPEVFNL